MLVSYVRDKHRRPIATLVAVKSSQNLPSWLLDEGISIGISICNPRDRFNRKRGTDIAFGRAKVGHGLEIPRREVDGQDIADRIYAEVERMRVRAKKYYR